MNWSQVSNDVLKLPHQQDKWVRKESIVSPEVVGIPYIFSAHRFTVPDGRAIDIKEKGDYYHIHWDEYNPGTDLIDHALYDAQWECLVFTSLMGAVVGAATGEEGKKGEGALIGAGIGLGFGLLITSIARADSARN